MRMWATDPSKMCRQHLVAEHRELHMLSGTMQSGKGPSALYVNGLARQQLLIPDQVEYRHDLLVDEMLRRGYRHKTPMPRFDRAFVTLPGRVCPGLSTHELWRRCRDCRLLIDNKYMKELLNVYQCFNDEQCIDRFVRDFEARPTDPATTFAVLPAS
jgi:hypothetical protein